MQSAAEQLKFKTFEAEMIDPLKGVELTAIERLIAGVLLNHSKANPINNDDLRERVFNSLKIQLTERRLKKIIRDLKDQHLFPVMANKTGARDGYGYWWCTSADEMKDNYERVKRECIGRLGVEARVIRKNFPELAGQLSLEDAESPQVRSQRSEISDEGSARNGN